MGFPNILKSIFSKSEGDNKTIKREFDRIGIKESVCPYCGVELDKKPSRKKKCPDCGNYIFVRTSPIDRSKILIKENEIDIIEEQWSIVNGVHDEYLKEKIKIENERQKLETKFGSPPSENDVKWALLNNDLLKNVRNGDWGLYRNNKYSMAEILRKENKLQNALMFYMEVCYLDLNGPNNIGGIKEYGVEPFSLEDAFLAPGIVKRVKILVNKLSLDPEEAKGVFIKIAHKVEKNMKLPLSPKLAWNKIENELLQ